MAGRDQLDGIDLKILSELQQDGRIRNNELAHRVGVSVPNCARRLRSLFSRGVVKAVRAVVDERLLGYEVEIGLREGLRRTWDWFRTNAPPPAAAPRASVATQVA